MDKIVDILKKNKSILMYLIFGVLTTIVNVLTYALCYDYFKINNGISTAVAWFFAVTFAFVTNKLYVFDSKEWKGQQAIKEAISFFACRIGTGIVEIGMMLVLVDGLQFNGTLMKLFTNIIVIILNYIASRLFVFKK